MSMYHQALSKSNVCYCTIISLVHISTYDASQTLHNSFTILQHPTIFVILQPVVASLHKLDAAGVGLDSVWSKMILSKFVNNMEQNNDEKLNLRQKKTRLWLWKDVGLGVRSQKVLREGRNRQVQRVQTTVSQYQMQNLI